MQEERVMANKIAWETKAYRAWLHKFGTPAELAEDLKKSNRHYLRHWLKYIGDPAGKRVLNLLGSNGVKAIALALLGADVTVVDLSEENRRYAAEVSSAAGVKLDYICSDVLHIPDEEALGTFDIVLMEFGILHYFTDLPSLFSVTRRRLRPGARLLLTDFHPFARTWASTYNLKNPTGNYFHTDIYEDEVAFAKLLPEEERTGLGKVLCRSWTVGEIISAVGSAGLYIRKFEEIASPDNPRIPEFFTIVADRVDAQLPSLLPDGVK
ncbi:class I SAM-dependent methyltransferase [Paenibacillus sp. NFR01]|uniref:class I SAM-dependent methyltransferase n=1 Tax=Paenibacillus sp. NFR01 TaxID=1566279 RepID=UPI0008CC9C48|nr:class I SAM-dependent methyltransferase [Paenibacillus sp. NFR01]SET37796.1 2-polyprenyl-3-methyl-5-hydroxy-6-metoxy-1,4-benzoquinol methylase [Paenibacillus sp. NFR01]